MSQNVVKIFVCLYRHSPLNGMKTQQRLVFYWWSLTAHASLSQDFGTLINETRVSW